MDFILDYVDRIDWGALQERYAGASVSGLGTAALITILLLGVCQCFFGYRLLKFWLFLIGAAIGGVAGFFIGGALTEKAEWGVLIGFMAALVVGLLSFWIYQAGIFLLCCVAGTLIFSFLFRPNSSLLFFGCILLGALLGFLGVKFVKPIVILSSSVQGGMVMGEVLAAFLPVTKGMAGFLLGLVLAVFGVVFQWIGAKRTQPWDKKTEAEQGGKTKPQSWEYEEESDVRQKPADPYVSEVEGEEHGQRNED